MVAWQAPVGSVTLSRPSSLNVQSGSRLGVFPWDLGGGLPSRGFQAGGWSQKQVNKPGQVWGCWVQRGQLPDGTGSGEGFQGCDLC